MLEKILFEKKINKNKIAKIMNVSHMTVTRWFKGDAFPRIESLIELSKILDIKIEILLLELIERREKNNN